LDAVDEGFMMAYKEEEGSKLVEDFVVTESQVMLMLPIDM
jgi:hypothetical protein